MSLVERLEQDMKAALKDREKGKLRLSVLRMARAALKNAEINRRRPLTEEDVIEVLAREVKQRQDAMEEYRRLGREDAAARLQEEIAILEEYLPARLTEEEIRELARDAIAKTGAVGPRDIGKVMGYLMPQVKGRADGRRVNEIVKEMLEAL
ncbi:MAG: uncharacterized protein PWQ31_92 [Eubacteriales bacterium]|nr:uncharacterized protein [Eubacteriales bacterium]